MNKPWIDSVIQKKRGCNIHNWKSQYFLPSSKVTGIDLRAEKENALDRSAQLKETVAGANATVTGFQKVAKRYQSYMLFVTKLGWFTSSEKQMLGMGWKQIPFSFFS